MPLKVIKSGSVVNDGGQIFADADAYVAAMNTQSPQDEIPTIQGTVIPATFLLAQGAVAATGVSKTAQLCVPVDTTITKAFINAKIAPSGDSLILDINKNGTSIWATTQANRLQLPASGVASTQTSFDTTTLSASDVLTIDIDQVGSTYAGQDVTVTLLMKTR